LVSGCFTANCVLPRNSSRGWFILITPNFF
jgi:hypothetical protein